MNSANISTEIADQIVDIINRLKCKDERMFESLHVLAETKSDPLAQAVLALQYSSYQSFRKDLARSNHFARLCLPWLLQSNDRCSLFFLGCLYYDGIAVDVDVEQATRYYSRGAAEECALCQCALGFWYGDVKGDSERAYKLFCESAERHYLVALVNKGIALQSGNGCPIDSAEAVTCFTLAAEQGYSGGMCSLGWTYERGLGVAKDINAAVQWYHLAAALDDEVAQFNLAVIYENGHDGVRVDFLEAITLYQQSAVLGHSNAQNNLGTCYRSGRGVAMDKTLAVHWFRIAAENDAGCNKHAQCNLGCCYETGEGVAQDWDEAERWYKRSSEQGHIRATKYLTALQAARKELEKKKEKAT